MIYKKKVFFHDDGVDPNGEPSCGERLVGGYCNKCGFVPDTQSLALEYYCPICDIRLTEDRCLECGNSFK
jgi:hypothetical protein